MHAVEAPGDCRQRGSFKWAIEHAQALPDDLRRKSLAVLEACPLATGCVTRFPSRQCIDDAARAVIIDWMTATRGDPLGDVARTVLLMTVGEPR